MRIERGVEFKNPVHPYDVLVDIAKCHQFLSQHGLNSNTSDSLVIEISNAIEDSPDASASGWYLRPPDNRIILSHFKAWQAFNTPKLPGSSKLPRLRLPFFPAEISFGVDSSSYDTLKGVNADLSSTLIHEMQHALDYDKPGLTTAQKIVQQVVFCASLFSGALPGFKLAGMIVDPKDHLKILFSIGAFVASYFTTLLLIHGLHERFKHFGYAINPLEVRARHAQLKYGTYPYWSSLVRLVPRDKLTV